MTMGSKFSFRMMDADHRDLMEFSALNGMSPSEVIRRIITLIIQRHKQGRPL